MRTERPRLEIVPPDQIPARDKVLDVPLEDFGAVYAVGLLLRELCEREHGLGVSAVQAGIPWRLFAVRGGECPHLPAGDFGYFANCRYEPVGDERVVTLEGCLSLRTPEGALRSFQVDRFATVKVSGMVTHGSRGSFESFEWTLGVADGGVVLQHEIDHDLGTDGLLTTHGREVLVW